MVKNNDFEILFNNYFMCYSVQLIAWKQKVCPNFYLKMVKQPIQNAIFQKLVKKIFNHRSFDRNLSNCECCAPKRMLGFKEIETLASALALHCNDHIIICIFAAWNIIFFFWPNKTVYLHKPTVVIGCSTSSWIFLLIDSFVVVKRSSLGIEPFHLLVLILIKYARKNIITQLKIAKWM